MMTLQRSSNRSKQRKRTVVALILLLIAATLLWILNSLDIIQGSWAIVFNVTFTGINVILSLLQWHVQALQEGSRLSEPSLPNQTAFTEQFTQSTLNKRKGAVVVYTSRKWRGITLHLTPGFQETSIAIEAAANVVEHHIAGQSLFFCHFPAVPPGHYTLVAPFKQRRVHLTVHPGHLSEIDWR